MTARQQFEARNYTRLLICAVTLAMCSSYVLAAEQNPSSALARYRVFSLKHISAEQGKNYLAQLKIGTVSQLPSPNTLLVTAQPRKLIKAAAILRLVDANEPFVIKAICHAAEAGNLPSNKQIEAETGDISIGTFSNPPEDTAQVRAIIDTHNDAVVAVAPADSIERIITAIEQLQKTGTVERSVQPEPDRIPAEQPQPAGPGADTENAESDELFDNLFNSLAEAEKKAVEQARQTTAPITPQPKTPAEPSLGPEQHREPATDVADLLKGLDRDTVLKILAAAKSDAESKLQSQPEPEQLPIEPAPASIEVDLSPRKHRADVAEPAVIVRRSYKPKSITIAEEEIELDLPDKLDIVLLLDLVHKHLDLDLMYDPAEVKGEITLRVQGPIKVKELYPLLESALRSKELVMTRKDNLVTVVPKAKVLEIDPVLMDAEKGQVEFGDVTITRIFMLNHIGTASAKNLLAGMKLGTNIMPIPETKTLIVTGYAYRMARIEELLSIIDKPGKPKKFRFRQLKYTMARTLTEKIKTLAEQLGTISITISVPARAEPAKPPRTAAERAKATREARARSQQPPTAPAPEKPTVYLDTDERTNRILMIGLQEQLDVVDELIDTLDVERQDLRTMRLYEIQHVGAEEVVEKLGEFGIISYPGTTTGRITAVSSARAARTAAARTATTPAGAAKEELVEEPQVVVIEATNSLLVNATAEQHIRIATIIGYVDSETEEASIPYVVYPLQNQDPDELAGVLTKLIQETVEKTDKAGKIERTTIKKIEEQITIVPEPKTYSLIVYASKKNQQWISSLIKKLDEYRPQVLIDVTLVEITKKETFDLDLDVGLLSGLPNLSLSSTTGAIEKTSVTAFYEDEDVKIMLEALQEKGYGRVLARPKLLVNDNEEGIIKAEEKTSVAQVKTTIIPAPAGGVPTASQDVTFQSYTAGITLKITPHIGKGDQLGLTITLIRTDFRLRSPTKIGKENDEDVYPTPPDLLTSEVTTRVTVPDGKTIILGGLERISQTKDGTKVPILGDIPFIGGLFRTTSNRDDQKRLYVFVKANIIRPGEEITGVSDIEVVSAKNRATFEKYEKEMQDYEDWPGIKPKPMDPLRILEAD